MVIPRFELIHSTRAITEDVRNFADRSLQLLFPEPLTHGPHALRIDYKHVFRPPYKISPPAMEGDICGYISDVDIVHRMVNVGGTGFPPVHPQHPGHANLACVLAGILALGQVALVLRDDDVARAGVRFGAPAFVPKLHLDRQRLPGLGLEGRKILEKGFTFAGLATLAENADFH